MLCSSTLAFFISNQISSSSQTIGSDSSSGLRSVLCGALTCFNLYCLGLLNIHSVVMFYVNFGIKNSAPRHLVFSRPRFPCCLNIPPIPFSSISKLSLPPPATMVRVRKELSAEQRDKIIGAYQCGTRAAVIARTLGLPPYTVYATINRFKRTG
jgi:hypothetical protein